MKNTSRKKNISKKGSRMSPGEKRRSDILARISYFKESAIIASIMTVIRSITAYRLANTSNEGRLAAITNSVQEVLAYLIASGIYLLYFEVAKFGWPKEKSWIKFRKIIYYISAFFYSIWYLGVNLNIEGYKELLELIEEMKKVMKKEILKTE